MSLSDKRQTLDAHPTPIGRPLVCRLAPIVRQMSARVAQAFHMPVETERVTLRLPKNDIALLESLVSAGEFMSISEAIRAAIRDLVHSRAQRVTQAVEARKAIHASADAAKELDEIRAALAEMQRKIEK